MIQELLSEVTVMVVLIYGVYVAGEWALAAARRDRREADRKAVEDFIDALYRDKGKD